MLTNSTSFMLAMSHVGSLRQQVTYDNEVAPNTVADWDRKAWSLQNFVAIPGVSVDPGNFVLAIMFLALRHAGGMEPKINQNELGALDESGGNRPASWPNQKCTRHPIVTGSATAGLARKPGHRQVVANLDNTNVKTAECLRLAGHRIAHP